MESGSLVGELPVHSHEFCPSIRRLYAEVLNYGRVDGPILNDVRFSVPITVEWVEEEESQKKPGKYIARNKKATVYLIGKTDTIIQGDNQRIIGFTELKTPIFIFPSNISKLTKALGTKRVPLTVAGILEPENPAGVVYLPQLAQMAVGAKVLDLQGRQPELAVLQTVSRANYRDHIEVIVTPEEYSFLYDLALWWVREAHINFQFDEMPAPEYFTGKQCEYCSFQKACEAENRRTGQERVMHPTVPGIQGRIEALHATKEKADHRRAEEGRSEIQVQAERCLMSHKWTVAGPIGSCQRCGTLWVNRRRYPGTSNQRVKACRGTSSTEVKEEPR